MLVELKGGDADLARGLAMHVAAMNPPYISPAHVPADFVAKEKEIALAKSQGHGKPAEILEKMISGKVAKTVNELCLTGQPYVLDTNQTVESRAQGRRRRSASASSASPSAKASRRQADDFHAEVMKQAGLA